jgi:hypothetical protein
VSRFDFIAIARESLAQAKAYVARNPHDAAGRRNVAIIERWLAAQDEPVAS